MAIAHRLNDAFGELGGSPVNLSPLAPSDGTDFVQPRDILIFIVGNSRTVSTATYNPPSGGYWHLIGELTNQGPATGNGFSSLRAWWAKGDIPSNKFLFTRTGFTGVVGYIMLCFSGCDCIDPIDVGCYNNEVSNVDSSILTTNSVPIVADQAWHCIAYCDFPANSPRSIFSATGFTLAENAGVPPPALQTAALLYNETPKSPGDTGTVDVSSDGAGSGEVNIGISFALRPAGYGQGDDFGGQIADTTDIIDTPDATLLDDGGQQWKLRNQEYIERLAARNRRLTKRVA